MAKLSNDNVFMVGEVIDDNFCIYSSFERAEQRLLDIIRSHDMCHFHHSITCVQIDTGHRKKTLYDGTVEIRDGYKIIKIVRDPKNWNGCHKTHEERILITMDYDER